MIKRFFIFFFKLKHECKYREKDVCLDAYSHSMERLFRKFDEPTEIKLFNARCIYCNRVLQDK